MSCRSVPTCMYPSAPPKTQNIQFWLRMGRTERTFTFRSKYTNPARYDRHFRYDLLIVSIPPRGKRRIQSTRQSTVRGKRPSLYTGRVLDTPLYVLTNVAPVNLLGASTCSRTRRMKVSKRLSHGRRLSPGRLGKSGRSVRSSQVYGAVYRISLTELSRSRHFVLCDWPVGCRSASTSTPCGHCPVGRLHRLLP
jgi:hypothetical protein